MKNRTRLYSLAYLYIETYTIHTYTILHNTLFLIYLFKSKGKRGNKSKNVARVSVPDPRKKNVRMG